VNGAVYHNLLLSHSKRAIRVAFKVEDLTRAQGNRDLAVVGRAGDNSSMCRWLPVCQASVRGDSVIIRKLNALNVTDTLRMDLNNAIFTELLYSKRVGVRHETCVRGFLDILTNLQH
jgi:hypothetical protein